MTAPSPPRSPGERPALRSVLPLPLVTALLTAAAVGAAIAWAPQAVRLPLAGGAGAAGLLLTVAVAVAVHARGSVGLLRHRLDAVSREAGLLLRERVRLAEEYGQERGRLTEEFVQERARIAAEFARERARLATESERERARLSDERDRTVEETAREQARLVERAERAEADRTALLAVTADMAGRLQALATGTLADLRAMEERHADEDVLADLLHLDHRTAQAGRLADSVAVLAGARSGRRWARPIPMESILRGAMGRIGAYRRVRLHSSSEAAVAGHAAEGVMHALAELLDNAANFSPPTAEVHVYVEEVPAGAIISVEDSGLVMGDVQLRRAERAVSGESADLAGLSGTRLGLAVVGRLARKHGLTISFRPSARGGTGVLVLIPQDILAGTVPAGTPAAHDGSRPYDAVRAPHDLGAEPTPTHEFPAEAPAAPVADPVADALIDSLSGLRSGTPVPQDAPTGSPAPGPTHDASSGRSVNSSFSSFSSFSSEFGSGYATEPGHEPGTPTAAGDAPTASDGLPRRRRGQSLADAESRAHAQAAEASARPRRASRPAEDAGTGAVRFSSFRRAVRGTGGLDQAFVQGTAAGDATGSTRAAGDMNPLPYGEPVEGPAPVPVQETPPVPVREASPVPVQEAALEPVRDAAPPAEAVRQAELEPAREPEWGVMGGAAWDSGPLPEPEPTPEPGAVRETGWDPEPAPGHAWEPGTASAPVSAAWEAEAVRELAWTPEPVSEARGELDPVRELAWEPAQDTRPAPDDGTAPAASYPEPDGWAAPEADVWAAPAPDGWAAPEADGWAAPAPDGWAAPEPNPGPGRDPAPAPAPDSTGERAPAPWAPDPRTHPHPEGDHTP
ncbi:ATP-binding protein [Streptomyces sp. NPDC012510]|uniref:ATP-binding protein n=1 Tax=Streptomyces sp. NPDC012510 TaxID=3364838 RepID=UPI0036EF9ECB